MSTVTTRSELRETGEPWCPEVPRAWQFLPIRRLGTMLSGGTPTADDENWGGDVPFVTPPDLRQVTGGVVTVAARSLTRRGAQTGSSVAPAEAILVSIRAPIGYVARTGQQMAFNQGCRAIIPGDSLDAHFLAYALLAAAPELEAQGRGTTFMELSATQLANVPMPVPPQSEQRAIADFLDRETGQIDRLIGKQERLVTILRERRSAVVSTMFQDMVGRGDRLKWHFTEIDQRAGDAWAELPLLSVSISWGVRRRDEITSDLARAEDLSIYKRCAEGDIVLNRMRAFQGALGVAGTEGIVSTDYAVLRLEADVDPAWLAALMRSAPFIAEMSQRIRGIGGMDGGNVRTPRINVDDLGEIRVAAPSADDQMLMRKSLAVETAKIDRLIAKAQRFIELARERRAALITAAVTGRIDVRGAA